MFIPHHSEITAPGAEPEKWMLVLHGIYGRGANWRSFAKHLSKRRPDWGLLVVDLRMHGGSQAAPPPHTADAAVADLVALTADLAARSRPVRAICGHSFGGKLALLYRRQQADADLGQTWVIDASPSPSPHAAQALEGTAAAQSNAETNTVIEVLRMLERLPPRFADRKSFVEHVQASGFAPGLGQWLAMNLEPSAGGFHFGLDVDAMVALLGDYFIRDAWDAVEDGPGSVHYVIGAKSTAVSDSDRDRIRALANRTESRIAYHVIANAAHWVHIDAPEALLDVIADDLR